jgi:hypothetical protein
MKALNRTGVGLLKQGKAAMNLHTTTRSCIKPRGQIPTRHWFHLQKNGEKMADCTT